MKVNALNARLFFKGLGATDAKLAVKSLEELDALIAEFPKFYQENDLTWVAEQKNFYLISIASGTPTYTIFEVEGGGGGGVSIYYGTQQDIIDYGNGDLNAKPSSKGYTDGDAIIVSRTIGDLTRFDLYEVSIIGNLEDYVYAANLVTGVPGADGADGVDGINGTDGVDGEPGADGAKGDKGDPLTIDQQGLLADRDSECGSHPAGWSYLATDTGELYFQTSAFSIQPCTWSEGIPFGRGENGATTYLVFKRSASKPGTPPIGSVNEPTGWSDAPPTTTDPLQKLWMSKSIYAVDTNNIPTTTPEWSPAVQLDGENGLDGQEGRDAGFWVIWSDKIDPSKINVPKPANYVLDLTSAPDWYDDVQIDDSPIWMAQINYSSINEVWGEWIFTKIAGERPNYKINLYTRAPKTAPPARPTTTLPYYQPDGQLTSGQDAEAAVAGWFDSPPSVDGNALWFTEISLSETAVNNSWSEPVPIDGDEGKDAGYWMIWSTNPLATRPAHPTTAGDIIDDVAGTIDLSGDPEWIDDVGILSVSWSAQTFYKSDGLGGYEWTAWNVTQTKGENGEKGDPLTIDEQGDLADRDNNCGTNEAGWSYLAVDTGELYFQTSALGVQPCTWTTPIPFGKGDSAPTTYFIFKRQSGRPDAPSTGSLNIPTLWSDSVPTNSTDTLWMSKSTYLLDSLGVPTTAPVWSLPSQISGEDGLDGIEGKNAGFWVIWSDVDNPTKTNIPKPINHAINLATAPQWYDDVTTGSPIWMATSLYDSNTGIWGPWIFSRVAGEKPQFKVNLFWRSDMGLVPVTASLPYYQNDGTLSTSADAVAIAPIGWSDGPPPQIGPPGDPLNSPLYMTELIVTLDGANNNWSTPIKIDGDEGLAGADGADGVDGADSGVWMIWSTNAIDATPASPTPVANIISADGSSLNLTNDPSWIDDVGVNTVNWMATSYYKPKAGGGFEWTPWSIVKVVGENGIQGVDGQNSRTYIPNTMFTRCDDEAISQVAITALFLEGDDGIGYTIKGQGVNDTTPATIHITVNGTEYTFIDGIPPLSLTGNNASEKIWMISTVLNSADHLGYANKADWTSPVKLSDTAAVDIAFHDGIGATHERPTLDPGDGNDNLWYDDATVNSYYMAQKNWSEGVSATWKWWKIRGEDGTNATETTPVNPLYRNGDPYYINVNASVTSANLYLKSNSWTAAMNIIGVPDALGTSGVPWTTYKEGPTVVLANDIANTVLSSGYGVEFVLDDNRPDLGSWRQVYTINPPNRAPVDWGPMVYGQGRFPGGGTNIAKLQKIRYGDLVSVDIDPAYINDQNTIWNQGDILRYVADDRIRQGGDLEQAQSDEDGVGAANTAYEFVSAG